MFKDFKKIPFKMPKKFSIWHIIITFGFFILLQMYLMNPGVRDITYSDFKKVDQRGKCPGMPYYPYDDSWQTERD